MNGIETWQLPLFWILGHSQVVGPTMLFPASVRGNVRNRPMTCEKCHQKNLKMASVRTYRCEERSALVSTGTKQKQADNDAVKS